MEKTISTYERFCQLNVGEYCYLSFNHVVYNFRKLSDYKFLIEVCLPSFRCDNIQYVHATSVCSSMEASLVYDNLNILDK